MAILTRAHARTTLSTTSKKVLSVPEGAVKVIIRNCDPTITVHLNWGATATTDHLPILALEPLVLDGPMAEEPIHMIAASGTPAIVYVVQA